MMIPHDSNALSQIRGLGTDIVDCQRIAQMIEKHGDLFLNRVYTQTEIDYCSPRKAAVQHYAGRWAAKEAILKALGTGWTQGIQWTDLEIGHLSGGAPIVTLHGKALEYAQNVGIQSVLISISHTETQAIAIAIATG